MKIQSITIDVSVNLSYQVIIISDVVVPFLTPVLYEK